MNNRFENLLKQNGRNRNSEHNNSLMDYVHDKLDNNWIKVLQAMNILNDDFKPGNNEWSTGRSVIRDDDHNPSFSISNKHGGWVDHGVNEKGSPVELIMRVKNCDRITACNLLAHEANIGLTCAEYATTKGLDMDLLVREFRLSDSQVSEGRWAGTPCVSMPYMDAQGGTVACRLRIAMNDNPRFLWPKGTKAGDLVYGIHRLPYCPGPLLIIAEGESNCHAGAAHDLAILTLPGKGFANRPAISQVIVEHTQFNEVLVLCDPDADDFPEHIALGLAKVKWNGIIRSVIFKNVVGVKDLSDLHIKYTHDMAAFDTSWQMVVDAAQPVHSPCSSSGRQRIYEQRADGLYKCGQDKYGLRFDRLTNFTARIRGDIFFDDGDESHHYLQIQGSLNGIQECFRVTTAEFFRSPWWVEYLGGGAIVYPKYEDYARAAIQELSTDIKRTLVLEHIGWRNSDQGYVYVHADGIIGRKAGSDSSTPGTDSTTEPTNNKNHKVMPEEDLGTIGRNGRKYSIEVQVGDSLQNYRLPRPIYGTDLKIAISEMLRVLLLGPSPVVYMLFCAVWRAVLGPVDFMLHIYGESGVRKTALATLFQQFFGLGFNQRKLPAGWNSTANSLEALAYSVKDALVVFDDYVPQGTGQDMSRANRDFERIARSVGNQAGRRRMRSDGTLQSPKTPRSLIISTGEDVPQGQSVRSRMLVLELKKDDIRLKALTLCQDSASQGLYAQVMSSFLEWLSPRYDAIYLHMNKYIEDFHKRLKFPDDYHGRIVDTLSQLYCGLQMFFIFALNNNALPLPYIDKLSNECLDNMKLVGTSQHAICKIDDPVIRFLELISSAIACGHAHICNEEGGFPYPGNMWGWSRKEYEKSVYYQPRGRCIGWFENYNLYLEPDAAYDVARRLAPQGEGISITSHMLWKRMADNNLLQSTEHETRKTYKVRRMFQGMRRSVIHIDTTILTHYLDIDEYKSREPDLNARELLYDV